MACLASAAPGNPRSKSPTAEGASGRSASTVGAPGILNPQKRKLLRVLRQGAAERGLEGRHTVLTPTGKTLTGGRGVAGGAGEAGRRASWRRMEGKSD